MKNIFVFTFLLLMLFKSSAQTHPVTFDQLPLTGDNSYWNGSDLSSGFRSNGFVFRNYYDTTYDYWSGFAYSNLKDSVNQGFQNQYAAFTSGGINGTEQYAVGYDRSILVLENPGEIKGAFIANTTYTALSMFFGDAFSKKFGGVSGTDKDYLRLLALAYRNGVVADTATLYLADFTSGVSGKGKILNDWTWFDFSGLGKVDSLMFTFESSDTGTFGINTPLYFCMDDLNGAAPNSLSALSLDFEQVALDSSGVWKGENAEGGFLLEQVYFENKYNADWDVWSGWAVTNHTDTITTDFTNEFSVISGKGYLNSAQYLTGYEYAVIRLPYNQGISTTGEGLGLMLNNNTYAYHTMKNGNAFAKKFGGTDGKDKDYFKLIIKGMDMEGSIVGTQDFYLADFRFDDPNQDYIIKDWTLVDISNLVLNGAIRLEFSMSSSDTGQFGMNTPAYFCMDHFLIPMESGSGRGIENYPTFLQAYPNPASDRIYFELNGNTSIVITDFRGVEVEKINVDQIQTGLEISDLMKGVYFITLQQGNQVYRSKFVKL